MPTVPSLDTVFAEAARAEMNRTDWRNGLFVRMRNSQLIHDDLPATGQAVVTLPTDRGLVDATLRLRLATEDIRWET